jgi:hypothetical protein
LITIKAQTHLDELYDLDNTLYVTALDIYRPGDFVNSSPLVQGTPRLKIGEPVNLMEGGAIGGGMYDAKSQVYSGGATPIHFAPVIKIMNGGSDFSTGIPGNESSIIEGGGSLGDTSPLMTSTMSLPQPPTIKQDGGIKDIMNTPNNNIDNNKKEESSGGGFVDFGKLVIKKMGF